MNAFGIPRFDPGATGIHLLWTWPDVLPLSVRGYDIQRLPYKRSDRPNSCETITQPIIDLLEVFGEYPAPLGPLRLRTDARFAPLSHAAAAYIATDHRVVFIQELGAPADYATIQTPVPCVVIGTSRGKSVAVAVGGAGQAAELNAPAIDTVYVYVTNTRIQSFTICTATEVIPAERWANAPYIVRGLSLPIHEADASLTTPAAERAAALSRIVGGETLPASDFARLCATLRAAVAAAKLGRSGARTVLTRHDPSQSFEELTLNQQLAALCIHPKLRRVLGFGWADRRDLVEGDSYIYRITGRFAADDLSDTIYDFHLLPSATVLPPAFSIGNLAVRTQAPVSVVLDPTPSAPVDNDASRRGIAIELSGEQDSWLLPPFGEWSAIFDLPAPATEVELEVGQHTFRYAGGLPWNWTAPPMQPLPAGPRARLKFTTPIVQLRLAGTGTLYGLRLPAGATGVVEVAVVTPPIHYVPGALPLAPSLLSIANLQEPLATLTGPIGESTSVQQRPPAGFRLTWLPVSPGGLPMWPTNIDAGPPLDTIAYVIDHRSVTLPSDYGAWEPITGDDNLTVGSRDGAGADVTLGYGCDLAALFPEVRPRSSGAGFALHTRDIFGETDPSTGETRPAQPFGSYHQYRIRSMDAVGRLGTAEALSNIERLEKHLPPPLPAGPQPEPDIDTTGTSTAPLGPRARALIKGAAGLTPADIALLGTHDNAILLEWGWREDQRLLDPETTEFRVYQTAPLDIVRATVTSVSTVAPNWQLMLTTDLPLVADELAGQWITTNGYPFLIIGNGAGTSLTMTVAPSGLQPTLAPTPGAVVFGRPLAPVHQRPSGWEQRVAIVPLTANDSYRHVFYDVLSLSLAHPRDAVWVGVSAADAQSYVADERSSGANANRPGNESAIATCTVAARYAGQPVFSVPPPLGDVPEVVTDEPTGRQVLVTLDLNALLGGALPPGAPVAVERASADDVTSRLSAAGGSVVLTNPDGSKQTIVFANPGDEALVLATLQSTNPQKLANRYLIFIIGASTNPAAFFTRISSDIETVGPFTDRIPPKEGRYFYFVRAADSLGHLSDGGALLPVSVRVPSVALATRPVKQRQRATATSVSLTTAIPADDRTITALLFVRLDAAGVDPPPQGEAELLRVPNRRDLYPQDGLRLLLSDGTLLSPAAVKSLADPDVILAADGSRVATLSAAAASGQWATLWCYGLTADGVPSHPCGPFAMGVGA